MRIDTSSFSTLIDAKLQKEVIPSWKQIAITVAKVFLAILIFPLFLPAYWRWGVRSYKDPALAEKSERETDALLLVDRYFSLQPQSTNWMGTVLNLPGNFGLWMPGVAVVASYLCEKKNITGLYVCENRAAFEKKLQDIMKSDRDEKCAFVLAEHYTETGSIPQHKYCIGLEKRAGKMRLAILDAQPTAPGNIPKIQLRMQWLKTLVPHDALIAYSTVEREIAYGCAVFALRDALTFLRDPTFFDAIYVEEEKIKILPPDYMVGTQSLSAIKTYLKENPELGSRPLIDKRVSLASYLKKYEINQQNHTITRKMFKYMEIVVTALENLSEGTLYSACKKAFLSA